MEENDEKWEERGEREREGWRRAEQKKGMMKRKMEKQDRVGERKVE